jgi:hypothetical protein
MMKKKRLEGDKGSMCEDDKENVLCLASLTHDQEIADHWMQCVTYDRYDGCNGSKT